MTILSSVSKSPRAGPPGPDAPLWHTLPIETVAASLETSVAAGLTPEDAAARLRHHGPNAITERRRRSALLILAGQFSDFMVLVLAAAAVRPA
jgi:Ca2+-transporting ATPase